MSGPRVLIVGGGIAGLTLAAALARHSIDVEMVERAAQWAPVGAGIGLGINAVLGLRAIGVDEPVARQGERCERWDIVDREGTLITRFDFAAMAAKVGAASICVHRADLHAALVEAARDVPTSLGVTIASLRQDEAGVDVEFSDGTTGRFDLVVGADGIRSQVRQMVFGPATLRYSGYTSFRMVVERPADMHDITEMWGPGRRIGLSPINARQLYCYTTHNAPRGEPDLAVERVAVFRHTFSGFHGRFPEVLAQITRPEQLFRDDIEELVGHPWGKGRVMLIGDAAHAMTPNLGQGGAMAIEDGIALARCLARNESIDAALARFTGQRVARVNSVQRRSRLLGRIGSIGVPLVCGIRDFAIRQFGRASMWQLVTAQPRTI